MSLLLTSGFGDFWIGCAHCNFMQFMFFRILVYSSVQCAVYFASSSNDAIKFTTLSILRANILCVAAG